MNLESIKPAKSNETGSAWEYGEFGLIDRIRAVFPEIDLTDDCAMITPPPESRLLLTTDAAVAGVHFPDSPIFYGDAGFRAFAGAASDINASAGEAICALLALVIPSKLSTREFDDFIRGVADYASLSGVPIVGGNIARGTEFAATITVLGSGANPVGRSGANPGDSLFITGRIGGSEAGRMLVMGEVEPDLPNKILESLESRFLRPTPPIGLGAKLAEIGATAMIDISDGLLADANHIAESSDCGIAIELERIALFPGVAGIATLCGKDEGIFAAQSGEEFELLFTISKDDIVAILSADIDYPVTEIGHIRSGDGVKITRNGNPISIKETGWRHF